MNGRDRGAANKHGDGHGHASGPRTQKLHEPAAPPSAKRAGARAGRLALVPVPSQPPDACWSYVGVGRGAYDVVKTYNFVGEGCGSFERALPAQGSSWRPRGCVMCLIAGGLGLSVVALLVTRWPEAGRFAAGFLAGDADASGHGGGGGAPGRGKGRAHDCAASFLETSGAWPDDKRDYCCEHYRLGCEAAKTSSMPYVCAASADRSWSPEKEAWCCAQFGLGCTSAPFDCEDQRGSWEAAWTERKKEWCCRHGRFCPTAPAPAPA